MDDLTLLRRLDAGAPPPTDAALDAARDALAARMRRADAPSRSTRPRVRRRALVVGGLAAAAVVGVAAAIVGIEPAPSASATVAGTLQAAAGSLVATDDLPDLRTHLLRLVVSSSGAEESPGVESLDVSVLYRGTTELKKIPGEDVWTLTSYPLTPIAAYGPDHEARFKAAQEEEQPVIVDRSDEQRYFWDVFTPAGVKALPRDPDRLIRTLIKPDDPDAALLKDPERALDNASALLGSGLADAELQAAVYRALEKVPGLTVVTGTKDIDGRPATAIGAPVTRGLQRMDIYIDPATGRYLGQSEANLTASDGAPAGTLIFGTAVYPR